MIYTFPHGFEIHLPVQVAFSRYQTRKEKIEGVKVGLKNRLPWRVEKMFSCKAIVLSMVRCDWNRIHVSGTNVQSPARNKQIACSNCEKTFKTISEFSQHRRTETGSFACPLSTNAFNQKSQLAALTQIHLAKMFPCGSCQKVFTHREHFDVRRRSGEKLFKCELCDKSYTKLGSFNRHLEIHSAEKQFSCKFCDKMFSRRSAMLEHLRTHTGEKPYKCKTCRHSFHSQSNLARHEKWHNGQKKVSV